MRYTIVIEQGDTSFGAYVPDLSGCVAAGKTREEAVKLPELTVRRRATAARRSQTAATIKLSHY